MKKPLIALIIASLLNTGLMGCGTDKTPVKAQQHKVSPIVSEDDSRDEALAKIRQFLVDQNAIALQMAVEKKAAEDLLNTLSQNHDENANELYFDIAGSTLEVLLGMGAAYISGIEMVDGSPHINKWVSEFFTERAKRLLNERAMREAYAPAVAKAQKSIGFNNYIDLKVGSDLEALRQKYVKSLRRAHNAKIERLKAKGVNVAGEVLNYVSQHKGRGEARIAQHMHSEYLKRREILLAKELNKVGNAKANQFYERRIGQYLIDAEKSGKVVKGAGVLMVAGVFVIGAVMFVDGAVKLSTSSEDLRSLNRALDNAKAELAKAEKAQDALRAETLAYAQAQGFDFSELEFETPEMQAFVLDLEAKAIEIAESEKAKEVEATQSTPVTYNDLTGPY